MHVYINCKILLTNSLHDKSFISLKQPKNIKYDLTQGGEHMRERHEEKDQCRAIGNHED